MFSYRHFYEKYIVNYIDCMYNVNTYQSMIGDAIALKRESGVIPERSRRRKVEFLHRMSL